ncbi:hypothetical protein BH09SUM1_BH09SUM1_29980 [soil metagenome]
MTLSPQDPRNVNGNAIRVASLPTTCFSVLRQGIFFRGFVTWNKHRGLHHWALLSPLCRLRVPTKVLLQRVHLPTGAISLGISSTGSFLEFSL